MALPGARMLFERRGPKLPYDAKLEYLESQLRSTSQRQYIDTLVPSQTGLRANVRFMWLSDSIGSDSYILAQGGFTRCYFGTYQSRWMFGYSAYWQATGIQENIVYDADIAWYYGTPYLDIDGSRLITGNSNAEIANNGTMLLLSRQRNSRYAAHARIYSCKLWQQGVLVRNMIPVRFTNELGQSEGAMYDSVSGQLFRNIGTGDFVIGPDKTANSDGGGINV